MAIYTLKDGRTYTIRRAEERDAKPILDYLSIVGGETNFLLMGAGGMLGTSVEKERKFIRSMAKLKEGGLFVGLIDGEVACVSNISPLPKERIRHNAGIGISVLKKFWHLGVGTATMFFLVDFAHASGTIRTLCLEVHADNIRAQNLYKRFGFVEIGRHKDRIFIDGKFYDEILMDLRL